MKIDMVGKRYNRILVLGFSHIDKWKSKHYKCQCDCGTIKTINGADLRYGKVVSCGCWRKEKTIASSTIHGMHLSDEYRIWRNMHSRCYNANVPHFDAYGGRGIIVEECWHNFVGFFNDMGNRPFAEAQIDRIDNNGNYGPSNCKWVTRTENGSHKRNTVHITLDGITTCLAEASRRHNIDSRVVSFRLKKGWPVEKAFMPVVR